MESWKKKTVELISRLIVGENKTPSVVPYTPQKTKPIYKDKTKYFKRTRPERCGVSSARLYSMLSELEGERRANVHNLLVICRGRVVLECSHPGYSTLMPHLSHSLSKTVTGLAVGILIDDGVISLSDTVMSFFPEYTPQDKRFSKMTVEHLLRMSSGVSFAELGCATSEDWLASFFESELKYTPGEGFSYNSMNSYVLSAILQRKVGKTLEKFVYERLFAPLGIENYFWESSPAGITKGGWGLYLSCESWAKIALMTASGGVFEGKRIVSESWLFSAMSTKSLSDGSMGDYDYGYHVWVGRDGGEYLFNGMFGQNVWVYPKNDIIVVLNSGNNELFQRSAALSIIRKYLSGNLNDSGNANFYMALLDKKRHFFKSRHWIRPKKREGLLCRLGIIRDRTVADEWHYIAGSYRLADNNASILPLFVRMMQNNLSGYIERFSVKVSELGELTVSFTERGRVYEIPVGLYGFKTTELDFDGEKYLISAIGEAIEDEDRNPVFKIELLMPELPNTRKIKITKNPDGTLLLRFSENPDRQIADSYLSSSLKSSALVSVAMGVMKRRFGGDFIDEGLDVMFFPRLAAVPEGTKYTEQMLDIQNRKVIEQRSKFKSLSEMIGGFIKDKEKAKPKDFEEDSDRERKSPFAALGNLLKKRREASRAQRLLTAADVDGGEEFIEELTIESAAPIQGLDIYEPNKNTVSVSSGELAAAIPSLLNMIGFEAADNSELPQIQGIDELSADEQTQKTTFFENNYSQKRQNEAENE